MQDDARAPDVHLVIENHQDTTSFDSRQSLSAPTTPTEADLPPGSLPPGSVIISNMEVVSNPVPTIDSFIAEVGEMKKEEEMVRRSSATRVHVQGKAKVVSQPKPVNQPIAAAQIQEKIKRGEIIRSEIL